MSKISKSFNNLTLRERIILFLAVLICCAAVLFFWVLDPIIAKQENTKSALQKSIQEEKTISQEMANIERRLQQDPLQEINNKIAFLETNLIKLDQQLEEKLVKFIRAPKMPIVLTKVLANSPGVKISELKSLPVKIFELNSNNNDANEVSNTPDSERFYQHTLQVSLIGDYNAIYQYLLNVESLEDKFYWYSIDYKVSDYPLAQVTLQIYTLSDQQDLVSG